MKDSGKMITGKAKAWKSTATAINTKATSKEEKRMAREFTTGQTEKSTMESGRTELRRDTACGEAYSETLILASGKTARLMDMVSISGRTVTDTRVRG